jgi:hypothetical protein
MQPQPLLTLLSSRVLLDFDEEILLSSSSKGPTKKKKGKIILMLIQENFTFI